MTGDPSPEITQAVEQFFRLRRQGRRASVDELLSSSDDPGRTVQVRTMVLGEILRRIRQSRMQPGSSEHHQPSESGLAADEPLPELPGYDLIDVLGRGGMGVVYEAYQQSTGRRVAVKLMLPAAASEAGRRRFEREVELVARLQHPRIVSVIDSGVDKGRYFYAMEYVEGQALDEALPPGEADARAVLTRVAEIAEAVDYAHQRGVLHRDLKPSNVLIDERGTVRLLDFGLARAIDPLSQGGLSLTLSEPGQLLGTLGYMSPEQSRGQLEQMSVRSDVYSLGAIAYELLTGRLPCELDGSLPEILRRIAEDEPPRPSALRRGLDSDVDAIVLKALEKSPQCRYATAGDLAADLRRWLADRPIRARRTGPLRRLTRWVRRHRMVAGVGGVAALVLLAAGGVVAWREVLVQAERQRERARKVRVDEFWMKHVGFLLPIQSKRANEVGNGPFDQAAEAVAAELADDPLAEAEAWHQLGVAYRDLDLDERAFPALQRALELRQRGLGDEHWETAETCNELALLYQKRRTDADYARAWELHQRALKVRQRHFGPASEKAAETLNNLGWLAKDQARYGDAIEHFTAALELRRRLRGPDHVAVGETFNDLAHVYLKTRDRAAAEQCFREALAIRLKYYRDRRNLEVLATMNSLGTVLTELGRYEEAKPLLAEALESRRDVLGEDHQDYHTSLTGYGLFLLHTGRYEQAERVLEQCLRLRVTRRGERHGLVAISRVNLAQALQAQGRFEQAEALCREALDALRESSVRDKDDADIASTLARLADVLCDRGALDEALAVAREGLEMCQRITRDDDHPSLAAHQYALGRIQLARGEAAAARELLERCVALLTTELPASHRRVALAQGELGECLMRLGELEAAETPLLASFESCGLRKANPAATRSPRGSAWRTCTPRGIARRIQNDELRMTSKNIISTLYY